LVRQETEHGEIRYGRQKVRRRQETGDRDRRQETGDRRQETGDRRQETGDRETGRNKQKTVMTSG